MENVQKKMAELCEAVAAKGGNVIIIGDVKGTEFQTLICQMQGKGRALAGYGAYSAPKGWRAYPRHYGGG